ncbi:MAG: hypothetical protein ACI9MR_002991 [Myxococcota bacterium]|jgi:hypothetical protein
MFADRPPETIHDRILIIRASGQLRGIDIVGTQRFAENTHYQRFAPGEYLSRANEPVRWLHMIYDGDVEIRPAVGPPFVIEPPSGVGWPSFFSQADTNVDAVALTHVSSLALAPMVTLDLFENNFSLVRNTLRLICETLLEKLGSIPKADPETPLGPYPERALTLVERMIEVSSNSLFRRANADAVTAFARMETEIAFEPGDVLWRRGDRSETRISLTYGRVRCTMESGESVVISAPYTLGFLDAMASGVRIYDVVCETRVVLREANMSPMMQILEDHPSVALDMIGLLSRWTWGIPDPFAKAKSEQAPALLPDTPAPTASPAAASA